MTTEPTAARDAAPPPPASSTTADVLVVGAGPTGLLLAGDLAVAGLNVILLERRAGGSSITRAFAVHARTMELLDARAIADDLVPTGAALGSLRIFGRISVNLAGLRTRFPFVLVTPQSHTERLLERRALDSGVVIVRGATVTALRQDGNGVELDARVAPTDADGTDNADGGDGADGADAAAGERTVTYSAPYAVGTDGVRSTVRDLLGIPFPGEAVVSSVMIADVRLERIPTEVLTVGANEHGFAFMAPFGDGWYRALAWDRTNQAAAGDPLELEDLSSIFRRVYDRDYGMYEARYLSRFHSDERQAPDYRSGRVFLAGDAAHCHSPAGGQGMNTGLQDAANLSWKLVATVRGWAGPDLLDSYQAERHPVGRMVLRTSGGLIRMAMAESLPTRAVRAVVSTVARMPGLLADRAAQRMSGIGISYASSAPKGSHRLTGRRIPDLRLAATTDKTPTRLYEALRGGTFVLVGTDTAAAAPWADRLLAAAPAGALRTTLLVRPDGYAAWAAEQPSVEQLRAALRTHLGAPDAAG